MHEDYPDHYWEEPEEDDDDADFKEPPFSFLPAEKAVASFVAFTGVGWGTYQALHLYVNNQNAQTRAQTQLSDAESSQNNDNLMLSGQVKNLPPAARARYQKIVQQLSTSRDSQINQLLTHQPSAPSSDAYVEAFVPPAVGGMMAAAFLLTASWAINSGRLQGYTLKGLRQRLEAERQRQRDAEIESLEEALHGPSASQNN